MVREADRPTPIIATSELTVLQQESKQNQPDPLDCIVRRVAKSFSVDSENVWNYQKSSSTNRALGAQMFSMYLLAEIGIERQKIADIFSTNYDTATTRIGESRTCANPKYKISNAIRIWENDLPWIREIKDKNKIIEQVKDAVTTFNPGSSWEEITSGAKSLAETRYVAMHLLREAGFVYREIAVILNMENHSSIINGIGKLIKKRSENEKLDKAVKIMETAVDAIELRKEILSAIDIRLNPHAVHSNAQEAPEAFLPL